MTNYKEVVSNWVKFTAVGDNLEGTLISAEDKTGTDPQGRPQVQRVYEILTDAGKFHTTVKKNGANVPDLDNPIIITKGEYYNVAKGSIDNAMKKIRIGQKVRFIFDSFIPSKDKMKQDFKLVKVYAGDLDEDYIKGNSFEEISFNEPEERPEDIQIDADKAF